MSHSRPLELLAPAKNADFGIEAINHGADAVYIGGPSFGARASAGNTVADIERLAVHAHRYGARVLVALNTILRDEELEPARHLAWQMYEAGADALIIQDMGLLELDLPPIQLHASTQTDNRSLEKVRFLEQVGFSQIVLARELSLGEIRKIAASTHATLEFFVHGALCVSYSGQCYISHAHTGRSANRGECSQACRLPYALEDAEGRMIAENKHLLSMKDNDQSANLRALAEAGIGSFKIEGRLKDLSYVKNITAHYRNLLDALIDQDARYRRASSGRCTFLFTPQPEKTFNRGATDYFVNERHMDVGAFDTPKFAGEPIGTVTRTGPGWFEVESTAQFNNGDGLAYFDSDQELLGLRVNKAEGKRLHVVALPEELMVGTALYRNRDQEFERQLEKKSAERRIGVSMMFEETGDGFALRLTDEDGIGVRVAIIHPKETAKDAKRAMATLKENLGKLGATFFCATEIDLNLSQAWFLPASAVNGLRRDAVDALDAARRTAYRRPPRAPAVEPPAPYPEAELSYLGNVYNEKARAFYARHGVRLIDAAYESDQEKSAVSLMITKHCLRFSFNLCPKQVKGIKPDPMTLVNSKEKLTLRFDCKKCEMHVIGKLKKNRSVNLIPIHSR
ncbi:MAG: U32 family peptidase [Rhodocyclaceae bacterium]|nr:U32 family peptidase [Rhodocyclaceae bacterium]